MIKVKLSELGVFKNGINFSAEHVMSGYKMIGIPDFKDRYIANFDQLKEVNAEIVSDDHILENGDILLVRSNGNKKLVGRAMIVHNITEKITFSGFCIRFRLLSKKAYPLYLLYLFKSPVFKSMILNTQQTSINNLNQEILRDFQFSLPPIDVQDKVIKTIHGITRKIENNKKINDNLAS